MHPTNIKRLRFQNPPWINFFTLSSEQYLNLKPTLFFISSPNDSAYFLFYHVSWHTSQKSFSSQSYAMRTTSHAFTHSFDFLKTVQLLIVMLQKNESVKKERSYCNKCIRVPFLRKHVICSKREFFHFVLAKVVFSEFHHERLKSVEQGNTLY